MNKDKIIMLADTNDVQANLFNHYNHSVHGNSEKYAILDACADIAPNASINGNTISYLGNECEKPKGQIINASNANIQNGIAYNTACSNSVENVEHILIARDVHNLNDIKAVPNSVVQLFKGGRIEKERYFNEMGERYLDIHYSDHGNPKKHPCVPHEHKWTFVNNQARLDDGGEIDLSETLVALSRTIFESIRWDITYEPMIVVE